MKVNGILVIMGEPESPPTVTFQPMKTGKKSGSRILVALMVLAAFAGVFADQTNTITIKWSAFPSGYNLQSAGSFGPTNWSYVTNAVIVSDGTNFQATIPATESNQFYRLVK